MRSQASRTADTLSKAAGEAIVAAIIAGTLPPGSRLGVRALSERFGYGATPLREALAGLSARGLVTFNGQRGFRVPQTSRADLADLVMARTTVEVGALALSILNGDAAWEARVLAALQGFEALLGAGAEPSLENLDALEEVNRTFHLALVSNCASKRLISAFLDLFEQTRRYRHLLVQRRRVDSSLLAVHREIADLCLGRHVDQACAAIRAHNAAVLNIYD